MVLAGLYCVFDFAVPLSISQSYYCSHCRALKVERRVLGVSLAPNIGSTVLTDYWCKYVEPGHVHSWYRCHTREHYLTVDGYRCGYIDAARYGLRREAEIAILSSFKTPAELLAFARSFLVWSSEQDQGAKREWREDALEKLREAYKQNPNRKDWQRILKKLRITK